MVHGDAIFEWYSKDAEGMLSQAPLRGSYFGILRLRQLHFTTHELNMETLKSPY